MFFALGFVLLPAMALTSPMLDETAQLPGRHDRTMAIPRSIALVGALILADAFQRKSSQACFKAPVWVS
jgi:MFS transporter, DHA2 family, multidrug resistance protein